jgi:hypothetical protein
MEYLEEGFAVYRSKTLHNKRFDTKGLLFVKDGNEERDVYVNIDFKTCRIVLDEGKSGPRRKEIEFS